MFEGIGPWHLAIVLIVVLLVFGPKRLPELSHSIGKAVTGFRQGLQETHETPREGPALTEARPSEQGTSPEAESPADGRTADGTGPVSG